MIRYTPRNPLPALPTEKPVDRLSMTLLALLIILSAGLIAFGVTMVYSTTVPRSGDAFYIKQLMWAFAGVGAGTACALYGPKRLTDWRFIIIALIVTWGMLFAARFVFPPINGAHRWIRLGGAISFQPSELAKIVCILLMARWAYDNLRIVPCVATEIKNMLVRILIRPDGHNLRRIVLVILALGLFCAGTGLAFLALALDTEPLQKIPGGAPILLSGGLFLVLGALVCGGIALHGQGVNSPQRFYSMMWPLVAFVMTVAFVYMGKDLGMTVLILISAFAVVWVAGLSTLWILLACSAGVGAFGLLMSNPDSFRYQRILAFRDPENAGRWGYQIWMCILALGSGGVGGLGLGEGRLKSGYLPEAHTDCILAVTGEELGFTALAVLLGVFLLLIMCCAIISIRASNKRSMLVGAGMTAMLAVQMLINVAVITSSIPAKGMPAPFISYGGSNMLVTLMAIGIIASIAIEKVSPTFHDSLFDLLSFRRKTGQDV